VGGPEFKPQSHQKKKKKAKTNLYRISLVKRAYPGVASCNTSLFFQESRTSRWEMKCFSPSSLPTLWLSEWGSGPAGSRAAAPNQRRNAGLSAPQWTSGLGNPKALSPKGSGDNTDPNCRTHTPLFSTSVPSFLTSPGNKNTATI
jgi:hypothetical protein